tara:strand:+ start:45 stop:482 length:438 start_codon:yes stop_codon:yes gene_type:complete
MAHKHSNAQVFVWQRGFKYTLTNGYTLSVAFGPGNYCDNRNQPFSPDETGYLSSDFEVAVFDPNDDIVDLFPAEEEGGWSDQVVGFVPASTLPMLISALKFWPVREEFQNEPETFERVLHARCRIFRNICKDYQKKVDKEAEASV